MAISMRELDPAFQGAGQNVGLEIWRIENFRPTPVPKHLHGKFFTGDSYLILKTTLLKSGALGQDIHYWLGKDTSQDEAGAAAIKAVELDATLGGRAVQYREVQGHETVKFLSYFRPCIIPQQGGIASGFKHAEVNERNHETRLYVCKGKHSVRVKEVLFARSTLNHDDVFILDTESKIFQFNGSNSSIQERAKALEVVQYIKDTFHDGKCDVAAVDDGRLMADAAAGEFWAFFGGFAPLPRKTAVEEKQIEEASTPKLLCVDKGEHVPIEADSLSRELLETNKCYLLDCGIELFVWIGKNSPLEERKNASSGAEELVRSLDRPKAHVIRVIEGFETVMFRSKFDSWPNATRVAASEDGRGKVAALLKRQGLNVKGLVKDDPHKEEPQPYIDCTGDLQVWHVNGEEKILLSSADQSKFYSGDCYIFQYSYPGEDDKEEYLIGTWFGKKSVEEERAAGISLATKMVESLKSQAVQARLYEGKEPIQFFSIFQSFIVYKGGVSSGYKNYITENDLIDETYSEDGTALFRIQGSGPDNMQAIQVEMAASSLNSSYCYILHSDCTVFTWYGSLTTSEDHDVVERQLDIIKAITALKKGAYLLKYGRRGKPKFCPFRLSNDESLLIWFSGKEEKHLRLSHVSRIMPGQRTAIFQRHPRPEKECQSFSLIYSDRSLDLICKDKDEAEVWFAGLKTLISRTHLRKWRTESRSDGMSSGTNSPRTYTRRSSPISSPFGSSDSMQKDGSDHLRFRSPYGSPPKNGLDKSFSDVLYAVPPKGFFPSDSCAGSVHSLSSGCSDSTKGNTKVITTDAYRISLSSAVSSSSQGSGHDDGDALGDVFMWGEGTGEGILGGGNNKITSSSSNKMDSLTPKALDSAVILDVQNITCGGRHAAVVTKQGEIYSWGEESRGRLGHGIDSDVSQPKLLDALVNMNIELVACGEYHSCAVTLSGDLYTWGDGTFGLLGHGNEVSHWVPRRVNGPLEGIHVSSISCGPWHTAVVTSSGQLFTFGDGTFGVLGHGDRTSVSIPREVESLKGLRTVRAACGVWHTAAVVEVMAVNSSSSNCSSGKLFTWGDGDKFRLGHGDKEPKLVPTCVAALVEPNFCQVACGHSMTVALTTSGHVYTMGSVMYGQLGSPQADGKLPVRVEGKLLKNFVEEISCGAYHIAVLTSRTEVYTWGKGANGRLGHGDSNDRNSPSLVEALKDKQVRSVVCGTNFTAAICIHKWVSGTDQSMCSGCRLPFNFKRKRHNCYNCALVYCHSCSSKKSLKASMAPNPNKPYRVCDGCFNKLAKALDTDSSSHSTINRKESTNQGFSEMTEEKLDSRSQVQLSRYSSMESFKHKRNKKFEFNSNRVSPIPNGTSRWGALNIPKSLNPVFGSSKKIFSASVPGSRIVSRATSPISRRTSPPRSTTPTPTLGGLASPKFAVDDAKSTNDSLSQEVLRLKAQVENLTRKTQLQEVEFERTTKQLKEAIAVAVEETTKCKAAKEVIKSLTAQLKDMAEMLTVGADRNSSKLPSFTSLSTTSASSDISAAVIEQMSNLIVSPEADSNGSNGSIVSNGPSSISYHKTKVGYSEVVRNGSKPTDAEPNHESEWVEQDEAGVYITLTALSGGVRDLKRVRFSRKRFSEKQAEQWWSENRERVYKQYNVQMIDNRPVVGTGNL